MPAGARRQPMGVTWSFVGRYVRLEGQRGPSRGCCSWVTAILDGHCYFPPGQELSGHTTPGLAPVTCAVYAAAECTDRASCTKFLQVGRLDALDPLLTGCAFPGHWVFDLAWACLERLGLPPVHRPAGNGFSSWRGGNRVLAFHPCALFLQGTSAAHVLCTSQGTIRRLAASAVTVPPDSGLHSPSRTLFGLSPPLTECGSVIGAMWEVLRTTPLRLWSSAAGCSSLPKRDQSAGFGCCPLPHSMSGLTSNDVEPFGATRAAIPDWIAVICNQLFAISVALAVWLAGVLFEWLLVPAGFCCGWQSKGLQIRMRSASALALGVLASVASPSYTRVAGPRGRLVPLPKHIRRQGCASGRYYPPWCRFCFWVLLLFDLPCLLWAMPQDFPPIATSTGVSAGLPTWNLPSPAEVGGATPVGGHDPGEWPVEGSTKQKLGVHLFAPHYQTARIEISLASAEGQDAALRQLRRAATDIPLDMLDCISPVDPLIYDGLAAFVAYPEVLDHLDLAAVVVDLAHAGGHLFSTVLPVRLPYGDFLTFVLPMLRADHEEFSVYVGGSQRPHDPNQDLHLAHGALVTVLLSSETHRQRQTHASLFERRDNWGTLADLPKSTLSPGLCVICGTERWFVHKSDHPHSTFVEAAARCIDRRPDEVTIARARNPPIDNLCAHGAPCVGLTMLIDLPPPLPSSSASSPQPAYFIFLDFRPLGFKPQAVYQQTHIVDVPGLLDDFQVNLPPQFDIDIIGGVHVGQQLTVNSGDTLVFQAVRVAHADDEDIADTDEEPPPSEATNTSEAGEASDDSSSEPSGGNGDVPPQGRPRSRSPRRHGLAGCQANCGTHSEPLTDVAPNAIWNASVSDHAVADSTEDFNPSLEEFRPGAFRATCAVFKLDTLPCLYSFFLQTGSRISAFFEQVRKQRTEDDELWYGRLVPVRPQPYVDFAAVIAVPSWSVDSMPALFVIDAGGRHDRVFVVCVNAQETRETLLHQADLTTPGFAVLIGDYPDPAAAGSSYRMYSGILVRFVTPGFEIARTTTLTGMLANQHGWSTHPDVPVGPAGRHVLALTDGGPHLIPIRNGPVVLEEEVADRTGLLPDSLESQYAAPAVADVCKDGVWCRNLVAVTLQNPQEADPEGVDNSVVFFLDCRPILRGLHLARASNGRARLLDLTAPFRQFAPQGHQAVVTGCAVTHGAEGEQVHVWPGQTLLVTYQPTAWPSRTGTLHPAADTGDPEDEDSSRANSPGGGDDSYANRQEEAGSAAAGVPRGRNASRPCPSAGRAASLASPTGSLVRAFALLSTCTTGWSMQVSAWASAADTLPCPEYAPQSAFHGCAEALSCAPAPADRCLDREPDDALRCVLGARPVPTPCRVALREQKTLVLDIPGPTLLEQCVQDTSGLQYWETCTLLETIFEHMRPNTASRHWAYHERDGDAGLSSSCILKLADHLPPCPEVDISLVGLPTGCRLHDVVGLLSASWALPQALPEGIRLHPATATAFALHLPPRGQSGEPAWFEIYTDGSYNGSTSSWAFAVVSHRAEGDVLHCYARGFVKLPGQAHHIGANEHSAVNGERTAIFWAVAWLLLKPRHIPGFLFSDSTVAAGQAAGRYQISCDDVLAGACRSLAMAAESAGQFCPETAAHVKSHEGHPYNELADTLAKANQVGDTAFPVEFNLLGRWLHSGQLAWFWLHIESVVRPDVWPAACPHGFTDPGGNPVPDVAKLRNSIQPRNPSAEPSAPKHSGVGLKFRPSVISVNVQTLAEDQAAGVQGRVPYVREQLRHCGANIVGLQETQPSNPPLCCRRRTSGTSHSKILRVIMALSCGCPEKCRMRGLAGQPCTFDRRIFGFSSLVLEPSLYALSGAIFALS